MQDFDYFTVFAEMRTGSNFLEANLNALKDVFCRGEAFNPHFIGYPNRDDCLGVDKVTRDGDPALLLGALRAAPGVNGFRYFHDHDARVFDMVVPDRRCAKVVLTRNPLDSYISWKIARATDQWKLTDVRRRRSEPAVFDAAEFSVFLSRLQAFQLRLTGALQRSGQTAFYLAYEDLQDLEVMNGLAAFLGTGSRLSALDQSLKIQNPGPLNQKVANFDEMQKAIADLDPFNLTRTPNFEPRRGPQVPSFVAAPDLPLLYMPMRGGPEAEVTDWLAQRSGGAGSLLRDFTQKDLRKWKRQRPGHRSFTVLRHPYARAHAVFCDKILGTGPGSYSEIRKILRQRYKLPLPQPNDPAPSLTEHRALFAGFLDFLSANLAGQTEVRVDACWATQSAVLEGMAKFTLPDHLIREDEMTTALPALARSLGGSDHAPTQARPDQPFSLAEVHEPALEARAGDVYQRDYMLFGFPKWKPRKGAAH
ncbi:nodulation protein NodH [Pseudooceanicola algae]|uniref:Sulfotransferase family protein n=1 Tax=Pseudooceanicola algae TaxID=1537215 RepID=A0A418SBA6_9RHOB|nr:nodulation protein NodH [Pseudooceanicola algae]QPM91401.1 hypothetical protein PSAL_026540 [Pseudooceanicola algae]